MSSITGCGPTAYCFDLDRTITKAEILPCIASELGIADEIATLTKATKEGHIEFEPSFRLRCLLLGQLDQQVILRIVDAVPLEESLMHFIADHREDCYIITNNLDIWIRPIIQRLGCRAFSSIGKYVNGKLQLISILKKARALKSIRAEMRYGRVVAVGDGANEAAMLEEADVGIAFGGVHPPAKSAINASKYVIHDGNTLCSLLRAL